MIDLTDRYEWLMIDSGAYSVWSQNSTINIDEYIAFLKEYEDVIDVMVSLDAIPGHPGPIPPTRTEVEESAQVGWNNYLYMLDQGLPKSKLVPVFHFGEQFEWLQKYIDHGTPYIGLSPGPHRPQDIRRSWLDKCMPYVCDADGNPLVKLHGFGVTAISLIYRYPWKSVDSSSWVHAGSMGAIKIPPLKDGHWDWEGSPRALSVSARSSSYTVRGQHWKTLNDKQREVILRLLALFDFPLGKSTFRTEPPGYIVAENEVVIDRADNEWKVEKFVERGIINYHPMRKYFNAIMTLTYNEKINEKINEKPHKFNFDKIVRSLL